MILKNVAAICRQHKRICLYDGYERGVQWVGDGNAFYPLHGIPAMNEDTVQNVFDVPEKQRDKFLIEHDYLPGGYDFEDIPELGEKQLRPEEISIGYMDAILYPVQTSEGLLFYDPLYLKPLHDKLAKLEIYERYSTDGEVTHFAAKCGTFVEAILLPTRVNEEKLLEKLKALTEEMQKGTRDTEERPRGEPGELPVILVDAATGEVRGGD